MIVSELPDFVDGTVLKAADVDLEYVAANSMRSEYQFFPDR